MVPKWHPDGPMGQPASQEGKLATSQDHRLTGNSDEGGSVIPVTPGGIDPLQGKPQTTT